MLFNVGCRVERLPFLHGLPRVEVALFRGCTLPLFQAAGNTIRCFLIVVIFRPSRETPVTMRKIWDKHDDILLVLTIIALWATKKTPC